MTYATQQNMIDEYGAIELVQLTDRGEPPSGAIDAGVLDRALAAADDEINAYLAARYALPLASAPKILTGLACDIARFRLYKDAAPAIVVDRYKATVRLLEAIAAGKASLGLDAAGGETQTASDTVQFHESQRVFAREPLSE